jgi:hypothetical protein
MNQFFLIVLLYIIFAVVGPLIRKAQKANRTVKTSPQKKKTVGAQRSTANVEEKLERYFGKLEQALSQKQAPKLSSSEIPAKEPAFQEWAPPEIPPKELGPPRRLVEEEPSFVELELLPESSDRKPSSLLGFDKRRGYMQGIILAEILGPPVSKRRRRKM